MTVTLFLTMLCIMTLEKTDSNNHGIWKPEALKEIND